MLLIEDIIRKKFQLLQESRAIEKWKEKLIIRKMKLFYVALVLAVANTASVEDDSLVEIDPFMTSPALTVFGEFPSAVFIRAPTTPSVVHPLCGGTVIDRQHVLTAAQCVMNNQNQLINPFWLEVTAGDINMVRPTIRRESRRVSRIFVHQNYAPATRNK